MARSIATVYLETGSVYNIAKIVARNASQCGFSDRIAVIDSSKGEDGMYSYSKLNSEVNKLAHALMKLGVKKGDRVFVLTYDTIETLEIILASMKIGAVYTPANFRLSASEIGFMIDDSSPKILIYDTDFSEKISQILRERENFVQIIEIGPSPPKLTSARNYHDLIKGMLEEEPNVITEPNEVCMLMYTAGTTGRPKGVKLTHRSTFFACLINGITVSLTIDDVYLGGTPLFHAGGTCYPLYVLMINGTVVLEKRWNPKEALELIKKYRVTYFFGIATQLKMLLQVEGWEQYVSSLRVVNGGGEPQPTELKKAFIDQGITYVCGYGLTETGATGLGWVAKDKDDPILKKPGECMGKAPVFLEVRIVDEEGNEVQVGKAGEIVIRREPTGAAGYWNRPGEETRKFKGDWIFTGDVGMIDEDGFFYVLGRKDDMIKSGGENIYPSEVERAIYSHPKVADVVVVRARDPEWGHVPKAIIVPKKGEQLTEEEITQHVIKQISAFKRPRKILFVDALPKTEVGKIDRKKVKELYEEI